jgi:hypothetical protein
MERPKVTPEIVAEAARQLAADNGWRDEQAADIAKYYKQWTDGYALAKELDSWCGWDIDVSTVEALDCMGPLVRELHRKVCLKWAKENDIQPPLPIGTMTTKGEITGIYEHDAAYYKVREPGAINDSRRLLVKFEDARAA